MFFARAAYVTKLSMTLVLIVALLSAFWISPIATSEAGRRERYTFKKVEKCMMRKINKRRARRGLRRLDWDRQLGYVARRHAEAMARNRTIYHDSNLGYEITRWRRLAQNVGTGHRCRGLFKAFWRSAPHRHNILGGYRFVGVGSERAGGRIWVHHVFEYRVNPGNVYSYP